MGGGLEIAPSLKERLLRSADAHEMTMKMRLTAFHWHPMGVGDSEPERSVDGQRQIAPP
jgi:hypothetical protein